MLYQNNPTPEFRISNPLQATIDDAERIIAQLNEVSEVLEEAIANERLWHGHYHDALSNYEMAETEKLSDVVILATAKEGPLGGIPVSGKGYDIALNGLRIQMRRGELKDLWQTVDRLKKSYEMAQVELEQTQTRFKALLRIAELKTNVLRASTI